MRHDGHILQIQHPSGSLGSVVNYRRFVIEVNFCLWYTNTTFDDSVHLADRFAKCVPERKLALIHTHTPVSVEYEYPT
jgi:hypothetical protein